MEFCASNGRLQPGFRFHPTDVELIMYYLKRKVLGKRLEPAVVSEVDIYKFHPMDLRDLACMKKDLNWYFFCPRGRKYGSGERTNRATNTGYWKATGNDRIVSYQQRPVGKIKTLIFHQGKPPKGERTDWVMHEFRLEDQNLADVGVSQDSYVLCKIFKKSGMGPKNAEQYGAPFIEEEWSGNDEIPNCAQLVPADDVQVQCVSAVTNVLGCSTNVSDQVVDQAPHSTPNGLVPNYCDAASMAADWASSSMIYSDVDQSCAPSSNPAANVDLSSKGLILINNDAANVASSSKALVPVYNPVIDQTITTPMQICCVPAADQMPGAADIASTSMVHVPFLDDDEIFTVDDLREIFGGLEDLDNENVVQGNEATFGNFYEGGMDLNDLD